LTDSLISHRPASPEIAEALGKYWGFDSLRPLQADVIDSALAGRDAVVVMPTGGGKSLCFQLPAVVTSRLTVVVSPLIALMKDQVDALTMVGVQAAALNSSLSTAEEDQIRRDVRQGKTRLLYVSPERLLTPTTLQLIQQADEGRGVARFAIDEAHCISAWGHDFRPEFRQLRRIKEVFPGISVQAFTATATPQVQRDIAIQLNLDRPRRFVGVFDRPNLTYRVVAKDQPVQRIIEAVQRYPDEGVIVYCLSRKDTETIANSLVAQKVPAVAYHAGLPSETRRKVSEDFARERANVIVATIAFGMGIDRGNVRCVIHECLPKSMEGYQQETGRAGRDGLPSECVLLYNYGDVLRLKRLLSTGEPEIVAHHERLLDEVRRFATSHLCRHKTLSEHFGQAYEVAEEGCGACDVCLGGMRPLANGSSIGHRILQAALELFERGAGRSFGVGFLVSVLTGARVKTVLERQADQTSAFGAFSGEPSSRVTSWVHQLLDLGLMQVSEGQYPVVAVSQEGKVTVKESREIILVENVALLATSSKSIKSSGAEVEGVDQGLYELLRIWRRTTAAEKGVPAYVIFHDATLMQIAALRPSSKQGLRSLSGVGDRRVEQFGDELVEIVQDYAAKTGQDLDREVPTSEPKKRPSSPASPKTLGYAAHFQRKLPIDEIANLEGVKAATVWNHLAAWVSVEKPSSIDAWVEPATQKRVIEALESVGSDLLRPVFEALNGTLSYDVIRVVQRFTKD
jgi:ATP-dependent DNA helicase RecQ